MISISVLTNNIAAVQDIINRQFRLNELVTIEKDDSPNAAFLITDDGLMTLPNWQNTAPPILHQPTAFTENNLLGIVYAKLGNFEKAYELIAQNPTLLNTVDLLNKIHQNADIGSSNFEEHTSDYFQLHNQAIALHYGFIQEPESLEYIENMYSKALENAANENYKAFTAKHYALLLLDCGNVNKAESILQKINVSYLPLNAQVEIKNTLCNLWMQQLTVPYSEALIEKIKTTLWDNLLYFEKHSMHAEAALTLSDAAHVATVTNSFSEALGYINKAIGYLETESLEELIAHAKFTKGNILHTWAQHGNPQFYRSAVTAYQDALRIFTIENAPDIFAEIQHQLGRVYAEIPDEVKKKGIWAAVSVSSFTEALNFYNKIDYPYQFAMICNNLGIAYTKYPKSMQTDNYDKALAWFNEALDIRTAEHYPIERVLTLSNYIEASWLVGNSNDSDNERYQDMMEKLEEILLLSQDEEIRNQAKKDIEKLSEINLQLNNTVQN